MGLGLKVALPVAEVPPATRIAAALTWALPLAEIAALALESTTTSPLTVTEALPEDESAPAAEGSRPKMEGATLTVELAVAECPPTSWIERRTAPEPVRG